VKRFFESKNKIYYIIKNKGFLSAIFAAITIVAGFFGYYDFHNENITTYDVKNEYHGLLHIVDALMKAFRLFGFNFPNYEEINIYTGIGSFSALVTVALTAILFFFKDQINKLIFKKISEKEHIGIFGLGQIARTFIDDPDLNQNIVIIDKDTTYAETYRKRGYAFKDGNAFDKEFLKNSLNFEKMEYALISFGDDKINIEFTKQVIKLYKELHIQTPIKLIIHINTKSLLTLFHKNFMLQGLKNINIKTFSYYEECTRDLFHKYTLDGDNKDYTKTHKELKTVLIGDNELIKRMVYKIISLSHFPNQNKHTIYIVNCNADKLLEEIKTYIHYGEDNGKSKFPTIGLESRSLDYTRQNFYENSIWQAENVENIIVCFDNESQNIEVGNTLQERVYLSSVIDKKKVPKIIMGIYSELEMSSSINDDRSEYNNMYTFGNERDIVNSEHLLNETIDSIAKLIHKGYGEVFDPDKAAPTKQSVEERWFNTTKFSDKLSNISQARHIDMKLKAMGLRKISCENTSKKDLLTHNRQMVDVLFKRDNTYTLLIDASKELEKSYQGEFEVKEYLEKLFKNLENSLFGKMIRMEHNRWNAYHYLEGWKYSDEKSKEKKEHDCLLPLNEFNTNTKKITILYDIYSFLYLPNYLAETGYKILNYHFKGTIGVIGYKYLDNLKKGENLIKDEVKKLCCSEVSTLILSVKEAQDRILVKSNSKICGAQLIVPLPFEVEEYKKSFSIKGQKQFNELLNLTKLDNRNQLYKKISEHQIDNCDILFSVLNKKNNFEIAETRDILNYAREKKRTIINIEY